MWPAHPDPKLACVPQRGARPEEEAVAQGAVDGVVREAIRRGFLEVEPSVAAEDIEEVSLAGGDVQHQAAAPVRQFGRHHAARGVGLDVADVQLGPHHAAEEVADPGAAAELVVETEGAVVAGVGPEGTEFELMCVLGR